MTNTVSELGTLLRVPNKVLEELATKACLCIGSTINDAARAGEEAVVVNIGIGTLSVNLTDMACKFIPSKELKASIKKAITEGVDPLELALERALAEKLLAVCDEVI